MRRIIALFMMASPLLVTLGHGAIGTLDLTNGVDPATERGYVQTHVPASAFDLAATLRRAEITLTADLAAGIEVQLWAWSGQGDYPWENEERPTLGLVGLWTVDSRTENLIRLDVLDWWVRRLGGAVDSLLLIRPVSWDGDPVSLSDEDFTSAHWRTWIEGTRD